MCSWCYGFAPVIDKIKAEFPKIKLEIITGGYSPGNREPFSKEYKKMLQQAWCSVNLASGQPFDFTMKFVDKDFCYDTEPSSRAFTIIQKLMPEKDFEFLKIMQKSFYAEGQDITKENVLTDLAEKFGIEKQIFTELFNTEEIKAKTNQGFITSRQFGVNGFPALLGIKNNRAETLTRGFQPFEQIKQIIENWKNLITVDFETQAKSCNEINCEI